MTMPPPTPVPRMTPKTMAAPAPAPSRRLGDGKAIGIIGQAQRPAEGARQILVEGRPLSQVELAFLTRPVAGEIVPGMPTPTTAGAAARLALRLRHHLGDGCQGCLVVLPRRGAPEAASGDALPVEGEGLDLGAAQIDADAHSRPSLS